MDAGEPKLPPILVVEDTPDDLFLLRRLLGKARVLNPVVSVEDGEDAITFLRVASEANNTGMIPCVVITDLKTPRCNGLEFVAWMRKQEEFKHTPVVMLSGSNLPHDKERAKAAGVTRFFTKFPSADELASVIHPMLQRP